MLTPYEQTAPVSADGQNGALEKCIRDVADGDRDALGMLYGYTHADVFGFALSIVKNRHDAEDVLQDVYVKIWQNAPGYQPMGKPMAWILTITRNQALMEIRRKSRTVPVAPQAGDWQEMFADNPMVSAEDAMVLGSVIECLDDDERQIVLLHAVTGLKHREIADLLNMGLSTVLSKYGRALKKLKKALGEVQ